MKIMTQDFIRSIPPLYSTEDIPLKDKVCVQKLFDPCGAWTFWIVEGGYEGSDENPQADYIIWGYATLGFGPSCDEFGFASMNEILSTKGILGLGMEADRHWVPRKLSEIKEITLYSEEDEEVTKC